MKTKLEYEQYVNDNFEGEAKELLLKNIDLYYQENIEVKKNKFY